MRIANLDGRATLVTDVGVIDIEQASNGHFCASTDALMDQLGQLKQWFHESAPAITTSLSPSDVLRDGRLGPVVSQPSQIFAIGLNYRQHAHEMNMTPSVSPVVFTKFSSALAGANAHFAVPSPRTDWEAELVVVIGSRARRVSSDDALDHVAGYCVGQDLSDRDLQMAGAAAQFSLGKSYENFAPIGPWLTTTDEVGSPDDLHITCDINGRRVQDSSTSDMIFTVAQLVAYVSSVCELRPGDVLFTGTPHGVGQGHHPPVFLQPGDVVATSIEKLGSLRNLAITG